MVLDDCKAINPLMISKVVAPYLQSLMRILRDFMKWLMSSIVDMVDHLPKDNIEMNPKG